MRKPVDRVRLGAEPQPQRQKQMEQEKEQEKERARISSKGTNFIMRPSAP